jgi:hypothetical protein
MLIDEALSLINEVRSLNSALLYLYMCVGFKLFVSVSLFSATTIEILMGKNEKNSTFFEPKLLPDVMLQVQVNPS